MNDNQSKLKEVGIVLTEDLAARSLAAAHAEGMSRSALIRKLLAGYLEAK